MSAPVGAVRNTRAIFEEYEGIAFDAELSLLASVVTTPDALLDVMDVVTEDDFAYTPHRLMWRAIVACDSQGRGISPLTIADELTRQGSLDDAGGRDAVQELISAANDVMDKPGDIAGIVADVAMRRRVRSAAREIGHASAEASTGQGALEAAEEVVFGIAQQRSASTLAPIAETIPETLAELARAATTDLLGLSTGFRDLDRMTAGFQPGQLIIVAARPGMGKTAMALALAQNLAENSGEPIGFLSYEMSKHELITRLLSRSSEVPLHDLRQGRLDQHASNEFHAAAARIAGLPLLLDDQPPESIEGVRAAMRRVHRRHPIGAIIVDYIQLMTSALNARGNQNRTELVGEVSRGLKRLGRELEVPVIGLSQLSRAVESRPNKRPLPSDLRESGSLEQDADLILMLYRPSVYYPEADPTHGECIISKQRNGGLGTVNLRWNGEIAAYSDQPEGYIAPADPVGNGGGGGRDGFW